MKQLIKKENVDNFFKVKLVNFFKEHGMFILFSLIMLWVSLLLIQMADNYLIHDINNQKPAEILVGLFSSNFAKIATIGTSILIVINMIILIALGKKELDISKIFLMIVIPLGLIHVFLSPLGRVPDEIYHSRRAYEVTLGHLITDIDEENHEMGRMLPQDLRVVVKENISYQAMQDRIKLVEEQYAGTQDFMTFPYVAVYTFISYVPQAIGMGLARIFTSNILVQLYAGRIVNLAFYITIVYFAIKRLPFKKLAALMIALLPIGIQQAGSLSPDALTNALSIYFVSFVLSLIYRDEKLTRKDYIMLAITSILVAIIKIIYLPLCALIFLIPDKNFDSKKKKWIILIAIFIVSVVLNLAWLKFANSRYPQAYEGANQKEQIAFILEDPYRYIQTCFRDLHMRIDYYIFGLVGRDLSHIDIDMSYIMVFALLSLLIFSFVIEDNDKVKPNFIVKGYIFLIFLAIVALLYTSEYLTWNPVGNYWVNGIQPRYFIPMLLLIAVVCNMNNIKVEKKIDYRYIYMTVIVANLHAIVTMFNIFMK